MPADYPIAEKRPDLVRAPSGLGYNEITLEAVLEGRVAMQDLRVTAAALCAQAGIAEAAGRPQLAENLLRAAELVNVPEEKILDIYNALRPGRATREHLLALADELESGFAAGRCAQLIREAAER